MQAGGRCLSFSELDITIATYLFWFNVFNSFLGGVLGSALVQQVRVAESHNKHSTDLSVQY